jgi:hypothetical protein
VTAGTHDGHLGRLRRSTRALLPVRRANQEDRGL